MQEVRVYNPVGKLLKVITEKDLEKRSRARIKSIISAGDISKIRLFKSGVPGNEYEAHYLQPGSEEW